LFCSAGSNQLVVVLLGHLCGQTPSDREIDRFCYLTFAIAGSNRWWNFQFSVREIKSCIKQDNPIIIQLWVEIDLQPISWYNQLVKPITKKQLENNVNKLSCFTHFVVKKNLKNYERYFRTNAANRQTKNLLNKWYANYMKNSICILEIYIF
jgi:hypothetical protein